MSRDTYSMRTIPCWTLALATWILILLDWLVFPSGRYHFSTLNGFVEANILKKLLFEPLEARLAFIAEGGSVAIDTVVETTAVVGNVTAFADWGDGTRTNLNVSNGPTQGPLRARFDYTYDTTGFFNAPERRQILQAAADIVFSKFSDQLAAITPSGTNTWKARFFAPNTGALVEVNNLNVAANELVIYVGARDLPGSEVGAGGAGGIASSGTTAWINAVKSRGQSGVLANPRTDFGPWGGSVAVDPTVNWHFGPTTEGLDSNEYDFLSAVSHEMMHVFGFGQIESPWPRLASGGVFSGPNAIAANGGAAVPLDGDNFHWREGLVNAGQEALMDPSLNNTGLRKLPTPLDIAALADLGWTPIGQTVRVGGSNVYGDNGNFPIQVTVAGSQGGSRTTTVQNASVDNVAPTLNQTVDQTARVGVAVGIVDLGVFQDPGFGGKETFQFTIDWGDGSPIEQGIPTIDRAGSAGVTTIGSFDGSHTYQQAGAYRVRYRVTDDDGGTDEKSFTVQVLGAPKVRVSVDRSRTIEDIGPRAAFLTVTLEGFDSLQPQTVELFSSDNSEATVPISVIVPAGATQALAEIAAVDDRLLDGPQNVLFVGRLGGVSSEPAAFVVDDKESLEVSLDVSSIREDAGPGAAVLRVVRSDVDSPGPLSVLLTSSVPTAATVQTIVVIPAGSSFLDVSIVPVDDSVLDGTQSTLFSAQAIGYATGNVELKVLDHEPIQWVPNRLGINETAEVKDNRFELTLPGPAGPGGVTVSLNASAPEQLVFPSQVVFGPGQQTLTVTVNAINDSIVESPKPIALDASAAGYFPGSLAILLTDDDRSPWTNSQLNYDVDNSGTIEPLDVLQVINFLKRSGTGTLPATRDPLGPPFVDVDGDGSVSPLDVLQVINELRRRTN